MKFSTIKQLAKEIGIIFFFGFMFIAPLTALYLSALKSQRKVDEINKKYNQKLSEIRECQTKECIEHAVNKWEKE